MLLLMDDDVRLLNSLKHRDPSVRRQAIRALLQKDLEPALALRRFTRALADADPEVAIAAVQGLARLGRPAVPALTQALDSPNLLVRREAVAAFVRLGPEAHAAVAALCQATQDSDLRTQQGAIRALGQIGPQAHAAVPALIAALGSTHFLTCRLAAWALGRIGPAAVAPLADALRAPDIYTRTDAAWALTQMGQDARAAAAALKSVLRPAAARLEARTPQADNEEADLEPTVPIFLAPRRGTVEAFLIWTLRALGAIGREAQAAVAELKLLLQAKNGTIRVVTEQTLLQIEGEQ